MRKWRPTRKQIILLSLGAIVAAGGIVAVLLLQHQKAESVADIYLQPATKSVTKGSEVQFAVRITTDQPVDTITASVQFDTAALTYKKARYTDSPFSSQIPAIVGDNTVTVQAAKLGGENVKGDAFVAELTFTAKKDTTVNPTVSAGNAALAGVATNPTLQGKVVENASALPAQQSGIDTKDESAFASLSPTNHLLQTMGADSAVATKIGPIVDGVVLLLLIGSIVFFVIRNRKRKQSKTKGDAHE